jgi:hypothetical protein
MAQDQAQENFYDFMYGKYLLKRKFGIDSQIDDYVEDAYNVWRDIGNIAAATHGYETVVSADGTVALPCNCEFIESVTTGDYTKDTDGDLIIWYNTDTLVVNPDSFLADVKLDKAYLLGTIKHGQLHPGGQFVDYELKRHNGNKSLLFADSYVGSKVTVIYRGIIMDDDGNPCLTRKEADAIAHKIAFIETQLQIFKGNTEKINILQMLKSQSDAKMQAAKIPEYLTQNFLDQLLAAATRHDRKVYNSSYKTMR